MQGDHRGSVVRGSMRSWRSLPLIRSVIGTRARDAGTLRGRANLFGVARVRGYVRRDDGLLPGSASSGHGAGRGIRTQPYLRKSHQRW